MVDCGMMFLTQGVQGALGGMHARDAFLLNYGGLFLNRLRQFGMRFLRSSVHLLENYM